MFCFLFIIIINSLELSSQNTHKHVINYSTNLHTKLSYPNQPNGLFKYYSRPNGYRKYNKCLVFFSSN